MARRLAPVMCLATLFLTGPAARADQAATRASPMKVQTSIRGATTMFAAPWGLAAQGSGQLRILPLGRSRWQTVHAITGGSLYRIAFDNSGRLLPWWEEEAGTKRWNSGASTSSSSARPAPGNPFS